MDNDDVVLGLTQATGPPLLNACSLVPLLDIAGLVDDPDRVGGLGLITDMESVSIN
jgi:hypothetical protein